MAHVVAIGRLLLAALLPGALAACGTADVSPPAADQLSPPPPSPIVSAAPSAAPAPPPTPVDALTGNSPPSTGPGAYRYRVEVPQLEGAGSRAQAVDAFIRSAVQRAVDGFLDEARAAPAGPAPSDLACTGRTVRTSVRLAALRVDCSERLAGADRRAAGTLTFNCDLGAGRVLSLQDLFAAGRAYLDVLSEAARTQLRPRLPAGDERALEDATGPVVDNFRTFVLDRTALVLVLTGRLEAPGQLEVAVPYADLQRYLGPGVPDLLKD